MPATVFECFHQVRRGETLRSIAARYHNQVSDIIQRNSLTSGRVRPGEKILVNKPLGRRAACGRTCVLITGKTHLRCKCTPVDRATMPKQLPPRYSCIFTLNSKEFELVNFAGAAAAPPYQSYEDLPMYTRSTTPVAESVWVSTSTKHARVLNPSSAASEAERAKFPIPTISAKEETLNLFSIYNALGLCSEDDGRPLILDKKSMTERARFPEPIGLATSGRPILLDRSSVVERARFPEPVGLKKTRPIMLNKAADNERGRFPEPIGLGSSRPLVLNRATDNERARFPVPLFTRAEIERSRFPVPLFVKN